MNGTRPPTTAQVVPGAVVNIVLKADQPTGRTVSGTIRDVLTRGNHPRGIKVRLADGRVGRVQSMATVVPPANAVALSLSGPASRADAAGSDARGDRGDRDVPAEEIGLDAYIKPARSRGRKKRPSDAATASSSDVALSESAAAGEPAVINCPVCDAFEGDATAVSHHVATHFEG